MTVVISGLLLAGVAALAFGTTAPAAAATLATPAGQITTVLTSCDDDCDDDWDDDDWC
jgi:hypothetical protein